MKLIRKHSIYIKTYLGSKTTVATYIIDSSALELSACNVYVGSDTLGALSATANKSMRNFLRKASLTCYHSETKIYFTDHVT